MITAKELQALNQQRHVENEERVSKALDSALINKTLNYKQRSVSALYVPELKASDREYVESLMGRSGYSQVSFVSHSDGRNGVDVHISFVLPPLEE